MALYEDAKLLIEMGKYDEAEARLKEAATTDGDTKLVEYYTKALAEARVTSDARRKQLLAKLGIDKALNPPPQPASTNAVRTHQSPYRERLLKKLDTIVLPELKYDGVPLGEVIRDLTEQARKHDPEHHGIHFLINSELDSLPPVNPLTAQTNPKIVPSESVLMVLVRIDPPLTNIRLGDALAAIAKVAERPLKYSVEDYGVVFAQKASEPPQLFTRTFKVDPRTFVDALEKELGGKRPARTTSELVREFFSQLGINFLTNASSLGAGQSNALFVKERAGILYVRTTLEELDIIEKAVQVLNWRPPQVVIDVKLVEVTEAGAKGLGLDWFLGSFPATNAVPPRPNSTPAAPGEPTRDSSPATITGLLTDPQLKAAANALQNANANQPNVATNANLNTSKGTNVSAGTLTGILTSTQFSTLLEVLKQRSGTTLVGAPRVVTLSGKQAKVEISDTKVILVNTNSIDRPGGFMTNKVNVGPSVDITPTVSADGASIQLRISAELVEFLGYDDPGPFIPNTQGGTTPLTAVSPLPRFRIRHLTSNPSVKNGETLVLGGFASGGVEQLQKRIPVLGDIPVLGRLFRTESKLPPNSQLLLFITPTLIDAVGNRIETLPQPEPKGVFPGVPPQ